MKKKIYYTWRYRKLDVKIFSQWDLIHHPFVQKSGGVVRSSIGVCKTMNLKSRCSGSLISFFYGGHDHGDG